MKTLDEMIVVMQAARDNPQVHIQCQPLDNSTSSWISCDPTWNWCNYDYRVKPEPRRWKIHIHPSNPRVVSICFTPEACEREGYEVVDVIEVLK